jgi:hypothetical protein
MPQDFLSMLSPVALAGVMIAMCFRPLNLLVKCAVLTALLVVAYGYYPFHTQGYAPGFVVMAYAVLAGYTAFSIIQLYLLRIFGFKAAFPSSFVLEGTITESSLHRTGNSDTTISRDSSGSLKAETKYRGAMQEEIQFQNDRDSKITSLHGPGFAAIACRGDRAIIAGSENFSPINILYNKTNQKARLPRLPGVAETIGYGLLKAIPFLGQAVQACVLVLGYVIPLTKLTVMGETRGPFDRRHTLTALMLSSWPLSYLWAHFDLTSALWVYGAFAVFYTAQALLIRDEHKRFNDMLWSKIQYVLVKDKLV